MDGIDSLKEIYQENKDNLIVFVGAGASNFLGIETWDDVLKTMRDEFQSVKLNSEEDVKYSIMDKGHPKTASILYNEKNDHDEYIAFMKSQFNPKKAFHYSIHIKILSIFNAIFTTNYDLTFENALNDLDYYLKRCDCPPIGWNIQKLDDFDSIDKNSKPNLVYLHCNHEKERYIFTEDEYKEFYPNYYSTSPNSNLESFLDETFKNFSFVFIGFSFDDAVFLDFFRSTLKNFKKEIEIDGVTSEVPKSFIFFRDDENKQNRDVIENLKSDIDLNIINITNYIEIEDILNDLREEPSIRDIGDAAYA